jgi:predicted TIM-barrel fold metal-dependent hydrolase
MTDTVVRPRDLTRDLSGGAETASNRKVLVVSCDGHVGPSVRNQLRAYCEARYLADFDDFSDELEKSRASETVDTDLEIPKEWSDSLTERAQFAGLQDPAARLLDMDSDGIAAEVLYHGGANGESMPFSTFTLAGWGSAKYNHLEGVGVRIYNRWLADYVSENPDRLLGIGHITVRDVDEAIKEVHRAKEAGFKGINLPAPRHDFMPYPDRRWDALWAACQDLDLTLCTHGGGGDLEDRLMGPPKNPIFLMEYPWMGRRGLWHLILSGVFHRYPDLRLALAEQFGDWVPATLVEMDSSYLSPHFSAALRAIMPDKPSDYFARNCFIGASFMSRSEAEIGVENQFVGNMMWGADYPHPEGTFPHSLISLRKTMAGLPADVVQMYLSGTASRAYDLDVDALNEVAKDICPTLGDIMEPYTSRPEGTATSFAFRDFGHWA